MTNVTDRTKVSPPLPAARELAVARDAAVHAGRSVMRFFTNGSGGHGPNAAQVSRAGVASNEIIIASIRAEFPDDAILTEATQNGEERFQRRRVWIVDPLNGATEFAAGIGEFSVMIALLEDSRLKVGVVCRPADNVLYWATAGGGAYKLNGAGPERLFCPTPQRRARVVNSRFDSDPMVAELCRRHDFTDVEPYGSVGLKCARIAEGLRDLYVHPVAHMGEWDTAAPELILAEAGGSVTDCRGHALKYNKETPRQPHGILAAHPGLAFRVLPTLADLLRSNGKSTKEVQCSD
jgi:3'-phosphoadenosine 5'-phosphosulfate (PAPS) 3'-phosphatase